MQAKKREVRADDLNSLDAGKMNKIILGAVISRAHQIVSLSWSIIGKDAIIEYKDLVMRRMKHGYWRTDKVL